jgi:hypothetical protein
VINVEDSNIVAVVHSLINVREQAQVRGQLRVDESDGSDGIWWVWRVWRVWRV